MIKPTITITMEGVTFEQVERARLFIHELFTAGVLGLKNGRAILEFDHEGVLQEIKFDYIRWKRNKALPVAVKIYENATIEITSPTQTTSGQAK